MPTNKKPIGREGHRERIRASYLSNLNADFEDRALLELFLTYAIPRKDVKPIAYALLNEFSSLENIFNADIEELEQIEGLGKNSAILFNLFKRIGRKIEEQRLSKPKALNSVSSMSKYVMSELSNLDDERFIAITLDNGNNLINCHFISDGDQQHAIINKQKLIRKILNDKAVSVVIAHNHPSGSIKPSISDINATIEILGFLRTLDVKLLDHIIVNNTEALSMASSLDYCSYFE